MPRRSRGHVYRKRTPTTSSSTIETPPQAAEIAPEIEEADEGRAAVATGENVAVATAPATYRQRIGLAPMTARVRPAGPQRPARAFVTDYSYVVNELKRIGLTFGGLIVLLVIISRLLH